MKKKSNELKMGESVSLAIHFCHSLLDGKEWGGLYLDKSRSTHYDELSRNKVSWDHEKIYIFKCKPLKSWQDENLYEKKWVHIFLRDRDNGETFLIMILMKRLIFDQPGMHWEVLGVDYPLDKEKDGERHFITIHSSFEEV